MAVVTQGFMGAASASEGAHTIFWPPDGRSLYLVAKGKLFRTPIEGDGHILLADSPPFLFSGAWLGSKRILLDSLQASYFVSSSGGSLEPLNSLAPSVPQI